MEHRQACPQTARLLRRTLSRLEQAVDGKVRNEDRLHVCFLGGTAVSEYIFAKNEPTPELARLRRIEAALDLHSHRLLEKSSLVSGESCLEVGAGAGSILHWLGERVGVLGRAVGIDKNVSYLGRFSGPPYEIIAGDVLSLPRRPAFDLIHCRYVLIHNQTRFDILEHLSSLLKPRGRLVVEEPDFESAEWVDEEYKASGDLVNRAIRRMFSDMSLDPGYGKRMPGMISRLGLTVDYVEAAVHLEPGAGPVALLMADSAEALRNKYLSTCEVDSDAIDRYIVGSRDPNSWSIYYSTVRVMARRLRS